MSTLPRRSKPLSVSSYHHPSSGEFSFHTPVLKNAVVDRIVVEDEPVAIVTKPQTDVGELFELEASAGGRSGEVDVVQATELGESLRELNQDEIQPNTRMSGIDMRSNLHYTEISSILAVDTLVSFRFLPINAIPFTRQKKRLSVSLKGKGRDDIVAIVAGKTERDAKVSQGGLFDKFRGLAGGESK